MTTIPDWLARRAALHPHRPALITPGGTWTFAALDGWATRLATRLASLGVRPGDHVAVLARNGPAYVAAIHAAPRCGAVLAPLNIRLAPAELTWQLADCEADLLLHDAEHAGVAAGLGAVPRVALEDLGAPGSDSGASIGAGHLPGLRVGAGFADSSSRPQPSGARQPAEPLLAPERVLALDAPHTIIYTSGATGRPKGAVLTIGNHWWSAMGSALNLGLRDDDCWLAVLPLFHVGGLAIVLRGAIYGLPIVLHERFDPGAALDAIDHQGVTIASLVAVMLQRILDRRGARPFPPHFRCALLGGGSAPRPLLEACAARGVPVALTYGLTEAASQVATLAPADAARKPGSVGQPLLPTEVRVVNASGHEAAPGEVGEIWVRGPTVTSGYHRRPEASAAAIVDGWLRTGDLGHRDAEGFLYVVDRRSDLIVSGGENVYPAEVEAVLLAHPAVAEAGVIGAPDPTWGQVPVAFVVAATGRAPADDLAAEVLAFCRERLAAYKCPRSLRFVTALPRTAAGKLQRARLREML
ncbi:MAG: o-succinylbenzoate--CoA ligase [Chloroflexaceae bacterium]